MGERKKPANCILGYVPGTTVCADGACAECGWNPRIAEQRRKKVRALFQEKKLPRRGEPEENFQSVAEGSDSQRLADRKPCSYGKAAEAALHMCRWIMEADAKPADDQMVLVVITGRYKNIQFVDAVELAVYDAAESEWVLEAYPLAEDFTVRCWMAIPPAPEA